MHKSHPHPLRELKLVPIGNSMGVRLPKGVLLKYGLSGPLILEEQMEGILIRPKKNKKLSWEETYRAMAKEKEDWSDFEGCVDDGLTGEDFDSKA